MSGIPNSTIFDDLSKMLNEEYNLESRFKRYDLSPELLQLAMDAGLTKEQAPASLFIADYLITASEVPSEASDEDRRTAIAKAYKQLLEVGNNSTKINEMFYAIAKLNTQLGRQDLYLAGKGIKKPARAAILFITQMLPFILGMVNELNAADIGIGVLHSMLHKELVDQHLTDYAEKDINQIIMNIWRLARSYVDSQNASHNPSAGLPYIDRTSLLYCTNPQDMLISTFGVTQTVDRQAVEDLRAFIDNATGDQELIYLRAKGYNSNYNVLMVRMVESAFNPIMLLSTTAEEINVTEAMQLLQAQQLLDEAWEEETLPPEIAEAMAILSLGDLRMFEEYDTFRESEYELIGTMNANLNDNETHFLCTSYLESTEEFSELIDGLDNVVRDVLAAVFEKQLQILPTEIIFQRPNDKMYLIIMDSNDERIVGTIAQTFTINADDWQKRSKNKVVYKRRTLQMRNGQLLSALGHSKFDMATNRIFDIEGLRDEKLNHAILQLVRKI